MALREWGDRGDVAGIGAPTVEAIDSETGRPLRLALVDESGIAVPKERVCLRAGQGADAAVRALIDEIPDGHGQISAPDYPGQQAAAGLRCSTASRPDRSNCPPGSPSARASAAEGHDRK